MTRNFGLKKREAAKGLRCEWQFKRDCRGRVKATLIISITLIALIAVYAFMGSQDAKASVEAEKAEVEARVFHVEANLAALMNRKAITFNGKKDAGKCTDFIFEKGN